MLFYLLNRVTKKSNSMGNILHNVSHLPLHRMEHLPWALLSGWVTSLSLMCWNWLPRSQSPRWATHHACSHGYTNRATKKEALTRTDSNVNRSERLCLHRVQLAHLSLSSCAVSPSRNVLVLFTDHNGEAPDELSWDGGWDFGCFRGWR